MRVPVVAVAVSLVVATAGCSGESPPSTASSASISVDVEPDAAIPPQPTRVDIRVTTDRTLWVDAVVHLGRSRCGARWLDEYGSQTIILNANVPPGTEAVTKTFRPKAGPGTYRLCIFADTRNCSVQACGNDPLKLPVATATATFDVRALNRVMRIGVGIGTWTLHQRVVRRPGFIRSKYRREKGNVLPCRRSFVDADRVDQYADEIMLAWEEAVGLVGIRTTLPGDRSEEGFIIGVSRVNDVLARQPALHVEKCDWGDLRMVVISEPTRTGIAEIRYLFGPKGTLFALETSERRC